MCLIVLIFKEKNIMIISSKKCITALLIVVVPMTGYATGLNMFNYIQDKAAALAKHKYLPEKSKYPKLKKSLDYSTYTYVIHNNSQDDLWAKDKLPFRAELMFPGYRYKKPVFANEVYGSKIHRLSFLSEYYDFGKLKELQKEVSQFPKSMGYAGVRLLSKVRTAPWTFATIDVKNPPKDCISLAQKRMVANPNDDKPFLEFVAFVGASYFRGIGEGNDCGLSARGIAINCTVPGKKEEFPVFREFWLKKPQQWDKDVIIYALLDGPSVTGAYQFTMKPGDITKMKVKSVLYFRKKVDVIGLCPMTSLFWYGENTRQYFPNDFRPEVHDSDGLILYGDKKQTWFPLVNYPNEEMVEKQFYFKKIKLFGLLQRDRNYQHYLCIPGCSKNTVPNLWVTPNNDWGSGSVRLTILPTNTEWMDNVNASWIPDTPPIVGEPYSFDYTLNWSKETPLSKLGFVKCTHVGFTPNTPNVSQNPYLMVISFDGKNLKNLLLHQSLKLTSPVTIAALYWAFR